MRTCVWWWFVTDCVCHLDKRGRGKSGEIRRDSRSGLLVDDMLGDFVLQTGRWTLNEIPWCESTGKETDGAMWCFLTVTFSLLRVSLRDCNLAVCSSSWALGVTARQTKTCTVKERVTLSDRNMLLIALKREKSQTFLPLNQVERGVCLNLEFILTISSCLRSFTFDPVKPKKQEF